MVHAHKRPGAVRVPTTSVSHLSPGALVLREDFPDLKHSHCKIEVDTIQRPCKLQVTLVSTVSFPFFWLFAIEPGRTGRRLPVGIPGRRLPAEIPGRGLPARLCPSLCWCCVGCCASGGIVINCLLRQMFQTAVRRARLHKRGLTFGLIPLRYL